MLSIRLNRDSLIGTRGLNLDKWNEDGHRYFEIRMTWIVEGRTRAVNCVRGGLYHVIHYNEYLSDPMYQRVAAYNVSRWQIEFDAYELMRWSSLEEMQNVCKLRLWMMGLAYFKNLTCVY